MKYTFSDGTTVDYDIIRKKNKNIYFRVKEDLVLYITAPMYVSQRRIEELIKKNEESIYTMYTKMEEKVKENEMFWYLGNKYYIVLDPSRTDVEISEKEIYAPSMDALNSFVNVQMLQIFNEEVEMAKKCFSSLPDFTLRTRKMTTRWGVCDTKKKIITLNTELIKKTIPELDYVIIHEMCHFFEPNHSKNFWNLVSQACPRYKELRKKLRD